MTTAASKQSKKILSDQLRQLRGEEESDVLTGSVVVLLQHVCVCEKACTNCRKCSYTKETYTSDAARKKMLVS